MNIYKQRIEKIRKKMQKANYDFAIFLSADPHASEYLPSFYKTRANLSGFSGSAGTLIVTQSEAFLFTDGRYFLQAGLELENTDIKLMQTPDFMTFLKENAQNKKVVCDKNVLKYALFCELNTFCEVVFEDLSDGVYEKEKIKTNEIYLQKYITQSSKEKIKNIQKSLPENTIHIISSLDDIAWILNLRGSDVECNPVFLAYLIIFNDKVSVFLDKNKLNDEAKNYLLSQTIEILDYQDIFQYINDLNCDAYFDYEKISMSLVEKIKGKKQNLINPSTFLKSQKNDKEIKLINQAHIKDGVVFTKFLMTLEEKLKNNEKIFESDISDMIIHFRKMEKDYVCDSFSTIAGFNENSALPHYRAICGKSKLISSGVLLIDTGAQYQDGTTDMTRTFFIGQPNKEFKKDYTMVLKSHIKMAMLTHKEGVLMPLFDVIARSVFWEEGLDYMHGTGHGVGSFLNVHEGPQVLSYLTQIKPQMAAKRGMLTSIEPGIYHSNKYGIRLENLYFSIPKLSTKYGEFLKFKYATMFPFETKCIDLTLLNNEEIAWINEYHNRVFESLSPFLNEKEQNWLSLKTKKVSMAEK